jgi:hypothetical protein
MDRRDPLHGWCSLRLRFDERELVLLKGAERLRGTMLAHTARPDVLRRALSLAKAGHKIGVASPGSSISLEEGELALLLEALRFAGQEVQWATHVSNGQEGQARARRDAVMSAFPELVEKGVWRTFGLTREIEALAARLQALLPPRGPSIGQGAPGHG